MDDAETMKEYIARAKSLALNVQYHNIVVSEQEISRRVLNGLPPSYAPENRIFALNTDFTLAELEGGLVRVEELNRSSDGTDGSHVLADGFKARSGGRSGGRGGHNGGGRGKRDGKGRPPNQRQPQHQPRHQREQQPAYQPQEQQYQPRHHRKQQPAHQQQYQQQEPQQQYQRYQPRHQPQQPAQHLGGWGPSRVCLRCGKHGHFLSECRTVPPTRFPGPYTGAQAATYSYSEDSADFGSGPPPSQSAPAPPDPHGPPIPSESSSSSFTEQVTLAQFAPPGKFHVPSESMVGDVTVPGSYLHSAFVVQLGSSEDDVWIADSGVSCHRTHDRTRIYNVRPPPPGRETITIGDRRRMKIECIGNMDVIFHGKSDQRIRLIDVAYVPDLGFNLYSLHAVQRTHMIVSDASGTHIIGANMTFPRSSSGSYLRATRLPAGTVGARRRQGDMRATNLLRQLRHPIPPPPQEIPPRRNMCATGLQNSNVPGVVTVLESTPFPPLSSVLGEIQLVGKTPSRLTCRIGTPLAAATLTPGPLKHGKEVDIDHLHVFLAHAHVSVLKATSKQHRIRLTRELLIVSCSACSRAKGHRAPTPHHATRRATQPLGLVHIDTAGPYPTSLRGSRYVVMFVDSASRLQRPYGEREKSAAAILSVVKRFVADMGVPRAFRTDNGTEYSNSMFVDFCNGLGIRREFTAPYTPQQN